MFGFLLELELYQVIPLYLLCAYVQDEELDTSHIELDDALMIDDDDISEDEDDDHEVIFFMI